MRAIVGDQTLCREFNVKTFRSSFRMSIRYIGKLVIVVARYMEKASVLGNLSMENGIIYLLNNRNRNDLRRFLKINSRYIYDQIELER